MQTFDIESLGELVYASGISGSGSVAVIVPLYNYEAFIVECLQSVVDQTLEAISVVIIDDASTDDGLKLTETFLRNHAHRFASARIVRHALNQGLSTARNSGIAWSAEPLLFMLDADNRIRPPALERLCEAIEVDGADFAYSQLFIFGDQTDIGCADIWHLDRLRHGNTIDAMALIRRDALARAGGYVALADNHGWEDYDLWCRFFTLDMRGVFLPELLCEHRHHAGSMLHTRTNQHQAELTAEMMLRYPEIFHRQALVSAREDDWSIALPLAYAPPSDPIPSDPTPTDPTRNEASAPSRRIAVVVHMFAEELTGEIFTYLNNIPFDFDVYVSTHNEAKAAVIEAHRGLLRGNLEIRVMPRQGRDIAPRLVGFRDVFPRYDYVLLLHSKVSAHAEELRDWRAFLLDQLVGSPEIVRSIFTIFEDAPEVGAIAPQHFEFVRQWLGWGENYPLCRALAARFGVELKVNGFLDYPSGAMLWMRTDALRPFAEANLSLDDFTLDTAEIQIDGTMAHAIERMFFIAAEQAGYAWVKVAIPEWYDYRETIRRVADSDDLRAFVETRGRIVRRTSAPGSDPDNARQEPAGTAEP
ncbi:rhamnan synthesis F family protein [Ancylobacter amanitiformis]|uniref:Glycosyltransferase involved in cell wall biosynthesis n=1 Tax=Ancylobacter amanitiformis TaxID=217069 RepID=A0ABU0LU21_9HYPH|nr:rhamnan synthesis F family protein [Ancylobacter amanitiformis]MDQ0512169.1 glycosyltransferase involved in cell wall biosynthesis [Ancylobacter amanitiformis]